MLYVLLVLVVVLTLTTGAELSVILCMKAAHRAEVAELKHRNVCLSRKIAKMNRVNNVKEGMQND